MARRARLAAPQAAWESFATHPQKGSDLRTLLRGLIVARLIISVARAFQPGKRYVLLGTVMNRAAGRQEIHFQTSPDLLAWTEPEVSCAILAVPAHGSSQNYVRLRAGRAADSAA